MDESSPASPQQEDDHVNIDTNHNENAETEQVNKTVDSDSVVTSTVDENPVDENTADPTTFKVPCIIGPKLPKQPSKTITEIQTEEQDSNISANSSNDETLQPKQAEKPEKSSAIPLPYKEPTWSGNANTNYFVEVLKGGVIVDSINLTTHAFHVIGRLPSCNVILEHPSISRYHAIIQYRIEGNEENPVGFYLYDLNSTHGTFLNKQQIQPRRYYRLRVGYMFKFGGSSRMFILQGPDEDQEEESELTVTELKELRKQQEEKLKKLELAENDDCSIEDVSDQGIDWGMGEDAQEEDDLSENPFALDSAAPNEDLYIDDPKKTLRGWFEREGYDLEYDVEDKGCSQFICRVQLPLDSPNGGSVFAEATVKGKKKEAVIACALEACRILDRHGLLRQANHESRKRKQRNWEEEDYYDSDEDTFLDRTGTIEKKRQQRIQRAGKEEKTIETYDTLIVKLQAVKEEIENTEQLMQAAKNANSKMQKVMESSDDVDELDAYMSSINNETILDKCSQKSLKQRLSQLQQEELRLHRLVNIAKPTSLPEIRLNPTEQKKDPKEASKKLLQMTGAIKGLHKSKSDKFAVKVDNQKEFCKPSEDVEEEDDEESPDDLPMAQDDTPEKSIAVVNPNHSKECQQTEKIDTTDSNVEVANRTDISSQKRPSSSKNESSVSKFKNKKLSKLNQSYDYDASDPDYALWMPPSDQSGDGKTKLNEKYGY